LANIDAVIDAVVAELDGEQSENIRDDARDRTDLPPMLASLLRIRGGSAYPSRSELLFAFIIGAMRAGIDDNAIVEACLDVAHTGCDIFEHCRENGGEHYVKRQLEHAANKTSESAGDKQIIKVTKGSRHEAWRAVQRALIAKGCQVFVRGGTLVEPRGVGRRTRTTAAVP
jgi:hypothetical protein